MQKRKTAAAVNKTGKAFVYASRDKDFLEAPSVIANLKKLEHASFECKECGTSMVVESTLKPLCITCGSHNVDQIEAKTNISVQSDAELTAVVCNACKHVNVLQNAVVEASGHSLYCTCCGTGLVLAEAEPNDPAKLGEDNVDPDTLKVPSSPDKPKASINSVDVAPVPADGEPAVLDDTGTSPDLVSPDVEEADADEMPDNDYEAVNVELSEAEDDNKPDFLKNKEGEDEEATSFVTSEDFGDEGDLLDGPALETDVVDAPVADADMAFEADDAGEPLMDSMELDDTDTSLAFVQQSSRLIAMKGPVAVATLTATRAGSNADLMDQSAFHQAIRATAKSKGLRAALTAYGFKSLRVKVMSPAAVNAEKARVLEQAKKERAQFLKNLQQSLALATAGLARNQWRDHKNVLSAAFVEELQTLGVRNPKGIVARVMATHGVGYSKELLTIANKLVQMPAKTRQALSDTLAMTREVADDMLDEEAPGDAEEVLDQDFDSITSRVNANTLVSKPAASASKLSATAQDILAGRKPITFASA